MLTAITRRVSPAFRSCQLEYLGRQEIDLVKAAGQHARYEACLRELGVHVLSLDADPDLPDSLFVEDAAIVLDEVAIIARPATAARRPEVAAIAQALTPYRTLLWIEQPATMEGGDVIRIGNTLYVGISRRTNER